MSVRRSVLFSFLATALFAGPVCAGDVTGAKQIVDKTHPLRCELISLQLRARGLDPATPEYRALSNEFYRKANEIEQKFAAEMLRYEEIVKGLTPPEMSEVARHAADRDEICVRTACGGSPCPMQIPGGAAPAAPKSPTTVEPQSPKIEAVPVR